MLKLNIYYGNIGRSESIEFIVGTYLKSMYKYLGDPRHAFLKIRMKRLNSRAGRGAPLYEVTLRIKRKNFYDIFISKRADSLKVCLSKIFRSATNSLSRSTSVYDFKRLRELDMRKKSMSQSPPDVEDIEPFPQTLSFSE